MERKPVQSSNVSELGYDADAQVLEVVFRSGGTYRYAGVPPKLFAELEAAPSVGSFLARRIRPYFAAERVLTETQGSAPRACAED